MASATPRFSLIKIIPFAILAIVLAALASVVAATGQDPTVEDLRPSVVRPGTAMVVSGIHFGRNQGTLTIAGQDVPTSAISHWSDDRIELTAPVTVRSGLLFVESGRGRSDGDLVQVIDAIPRANDPAGRPGAPQIASLSKSELTVGTIVTISGSNFGDQRRSSRVVFPGEDGEIAPAPASVSYPVWSDNEIHVRVPDGVTAGFLYLETEWGPSNSRRVSAEYPAGRVIRGRSVEIGLRYGVEIGAVVTGDDDHRDGGPGSYDIAVWLPEVAATSFQSNVRQLQVAGSSPSAGFPIRWNDVGNDFSALVAKAVVVDRFTAEADFDPVSAPSFYESESGFFAYFTADAPQLPVSHQRFADIAAQLRARINNPITIANGVYRWVLDHMLFDSAATESDALSALESGIGDEQAYSLLLVTLLRAARIPARPVGGIRVSSDQVARPHLWAEFFVSHIGWIPLDPSLADGAGPRPPNDVQNPREYYFGNLDPYRVTFLRGGLADLPLFPDGTAYWPDNPYTIQRVYGEAGSGIDAAEIDWLAPALLGVYES